MDFKFPDVGEGLHEAKLVKWHVAEGDSVKEDDILAEVETDKAVVDIPSPHTGTITTLHVKQGENAIVGEVFITFDGAAKPAEAAPAQEEAGWQPPSKPAKPESKKTSAPEQPAPQKTAPEHGTKRIESTLAPTPPTPEEHTPKASAPAPQHNQGPVSKAPKRVLAAPSTRRLARELKVDIHSVSGTGPSGRVTVQDVQVAAGNSSQPAQEPAKPAQEPEQTHEVGWKPPAPQTTSAKKLESRPAAEPKEEPAPSPAPQETSTQAPSQHYTGIRKAIGEHMQQAAQAPAVTLFARADLTALSDLRGHLKEWAQKQGAKLTYLPLIAKAVCGALKKHPELNAHFTGNDIIKQDSIHLGIAVDTEHGLFVPVIKNADRTSVLDTAKRIEELAQQARNKKLSKEDMAGSTFTISSIGPLRVEGFTPILNSPEVGILGVGGIRDEPWVVDGELTVRSICTLSLTFDHRALDGAAGARFLTTLVALLEDPEMLILQGV